MLSVEVPSGSSTGRRKGVAPPALTNIPVTVAGADSVDSEADEALSTDVPVSSSGLCEVEMDPEAAAMWKKFLAGSRTTGVPMWNNRMVEDLPKVCYETATVWFGCGGLIVHISCMLCARSMLVKSESSLQYSQSMSRQAHPLRAADGMESARGFLTPAHSLRCTGLYPTCAGCTASLLVARVQVSRKEMDKQTQKIRSAAAPEDREAIVEADMEQLSRQLQQLDHAPIGRAARAAWLKEQQQKRQQQAQAQPQVAAGSRSTSSSPASERAKGVGAVDKSNPFAIPQEVRANWDADLEGDELMPPAPRKQTSRAQPANNGSRSGSRNDSRSGNRSSPSAGSDNPFAIPKDALAQWKAEEHIYTEPAKPLLGGVLGGLVTKFTSGKAQPSTAQEHQERRRHALRAEAKEAAAILRLQQQEEEQRQRQQVQAGRAGLQPRQQQQMQKPMPAAQPQAPSATPAAAAAAPAGFEGLQEGSPEWNEKMRQEMLRNGAARRARMQQMRSQGGPGAQPGMQAQQRDAAAARSSGSSTLSAVSAADASSVTAAIPAPQQKAPAGSAVGANVAEGAGSGAAHKQEVDQSNPFAG